MHNLQNILDILRQHKPELQKKYPIGRLGVFGSFARGEASENSDVDIAVEIEGLIGIKTDVVPLRSIKPQYLASVQKDIVLAASNPHSTKFDIVNERKGKAS